MEMLLTVIVSWLSINFGLPATYEHPDVRLIDQAGMVDVRASMLSAEDEERLRATVNQGNGFVALYDDISQTIYLPQDWSAASQADVSVLVHEMVHHLQNSANLTHACEEARERSAYEAQARWLEHVGTTLEHEFELDAMSMLFLTKCYY